MTAVCWLIRRAQDLPPDDAWLATDEADRLASLRFQQRRASWRLGRWTAKQALAACLAGPPVPLSALAVRAAADGAPEAFLNDRRVPLSLSISHRDDVALSTVAPGAVALGCDLEKIEPRSAAFIADYFTRQEQEQVARSPEAERPRLANLIWTAKESTLKALRTGLRIDTHRVDVTVPPTTAATGWHPLTVRYTPEERTFHGWWRTEGRYVMSLVALPAPDEPGPCLRQHSHRPDQRS